ncbi:hypothetical protein BH11MYX2_BH11MYX2_37010 [soil metagenome]
MPIGTATYNRDRLYADAELARGLVGGERASR